jgi:hypothetical protein
LGVRTLVLAFFTGFPVDFLAILILPDVAEQMGDAGRRGKSFVRLALAWRVRR